MWKIPLFDLNYTDMEKDAVVGVLETKWLTSGEQTASFEQEFAYYLGQGIQCLAVSNGTAALQLALLSLGIGPGDEVIISGLTFIADLNVVMLTGATPVLADIKSLKDWNLDPEVVKEKITPRTKALILVHYAGWPCDMKELQAICREKEICMIEDAAHAPGAVYQGQKCGAFGDISCFSFFSNKNLAVGEGGMVATKSREVFESAKLLRSHGMTSMTIDRHQGRNISYDVVLPGMNCRIDEIRAALGRVQLKKLETANLKRRNRVKDYIRELEDVSQVTIPWEPCPPNLIPSGHIFPILLPPGIKQVDFMTALKSKGIQTSIHYPAMNDFAYYKSRLNQPLEKADQVSRRMVTLPLFPDLTEDQVRTVCREIKLFFK